MEKIISLIIVALILGLTWALVSEGLWGAALMFFNVVFSAMLAFNFYEPLAVLVDSTGIGWGFSDTLCMLGIFSISVTLLRLTTETLAPAQVRFPDPIYQIGRIAFGLGGACVTMAVIILAFHAAPVHKKIFQVVDYESKPPFGMGFDHAFLNFFQRETGSVFARYGVGTRDPFQQFGRGPGGELIPVQFFDPRAEWLIKRQESRPYGEGSVIGGDAVAAAGGEGAGGGDGQPAGGAGGPGRGGARGGGGGPRGGPGRGGDRGAADTPPN
jgi:hypothetical protein